MVPRMTDYTDDDRFRRGKRIEYIISMFGQLNDQIKYIRALTGE